MISAQFQKFMPSVCPSCGSELTFDGIHLMCVNDDCKGKIAKILASAIGVLDLKGVGGTTIMPFAQDFKNLFRIYQWILLNHKDPDFSLERYGIKKGSRSHEIFVSSFTNIKSLKYSQVFLLMGFDGIGRKISEQAAREYNGLTPNYSGLEKVLVAKLQDEDVVSYIKSCVEFLESHGVTIDRPMDTVDGDTIYICMTGSPKEFGYKTKEEFIKNFPNCKESDLKNAKYLITDSYSSSSSKMKVAEKKGITIKTYGDFKS